MTKHTIKENVDKMMRFLNENPQRYIRIKRLAEDTDLNWRTIRDYLMKTIESLLENSKSEIQKQFDIAKLRQDKMDHAEMRLKTFMQDNDLDKIFKKLGLEINTSYLATRIFKSCFSFLYFSLIRVSFLILSFEIPMLSL